MSDKFRGAYPSLPMVPKDYSASSGTTVTTGTSAIPGLSHTFTAAPNATYLVMVTADVIINTAGTGNIVEAVLDGFALAPGLNSSGAAGTRVTGCQTYLIVSPSVGSHTVTVQTRNAAGGSATVNVTHTRLVFFRLA